jgi:hypothetical protein
MLKKMMLLAMAVGAILAFAAPAAMAQVQITDSEGEPLGAVAFDSTNLRSTTANGILACETVSLTGTASGGTISGITGTATGALPGGECRVLNGSGETVTGAKITTISGHADLDAGTASFTFSYDVTVAPGVYVSGCHFVATEQAVTHGETSVSIPGAAMTGSGPATPPCSTVGELHGTLNIQNGATIDG